MATNHHKYVFDSRLELKDAGLVAASAGATVDGSAKILDLGTSYVSGDVVVDITAIEVASGNELYEIEWQLSSSSTFASAINVAAVLKLGDSSVTGGSADNATGRHILRVSNEFNGTVFQYARLYTRIAGTIATGINYIAFLAKD